MKYFLLIFITLSVVYSCSTDDKNDQSENTEIKLDLIKTEQIKDKITQKKENNFYELILAKDTANTNLIVFIDPHGDGKFISDKIKGISNNFNSNVICLKNVENNIANFIDLISKDIEFYKQETNKKVDKLYIVGFSGGARMAFQYANRKNVDGVVMCGAGLGNMIKNPIDFPVVFIAGTADFNFNEQYYSPFSDVAENRNLLALTFSGKHEWPNNNLLLFSVNFLKSKCNKINSAFEYSQLMNDYNEYKKHNELFNAYKKIEAINKIFNTGESKKEFNNFISSDSFKEFATKFEVSLQIEFDRNNGLASAMPSQTWEWWNDKIDEIDKIIESSDDILEVNSYKRTRAYLGVIMFSVVNKEINKSNSLNIEKYLNIYEKLEPENKDMKKFKDIYAYQNNNLN